MLRSSKVRHPPMPSLPHCTALRMQAPRSQAPRSAPSELVISVCALITELVVPNFEAYEETAVRLATDRVPPCLAALEPRRIAALAAEPSLPARPARRCLLTSCACCPAATAGVQARLAAITEQLRDGRRCLALFDTRSWVHSFERVMQCASPGSALRPTRTRSCTRAMSTRPQRMHACARVCAR
jgi:hypothetical protein